MKDDLSPEVREGTVAILVSMDGRLLLQLRDDLPRVSDPGKLGLFGGRREGSETFLECVVREVHEEIGLYLPPERLELLGKHFGPDPWRPNRLLHGEIYIARDVPVDGPTITEGSLRVVAPDELQQIQHLLAPGTKYALEMFRNRELG
jgi:8-oxo-dGTP pyrophosphatase MutT (NUDIX family)